MKLSTIKSTKCYINKNFIKLYPGPFVNLGIGTSALELELILKTLLFPIPMDPKLRRVVTYDDGTPPTKSRDTSISW